MGGWEQPHYVASGVYNGQVLFSFTLFTSSFAFILVTMFTFTRVLVIRVSTKVTSCSNS
jgi:hypothetical protein